MLNSKGGEIKECFRKRGGVNHVWWCQKGGEIKQKATHQKQNYKLWEINAKYNAKYNAHKNNIKSTMLSTMHKITFKLLLYICSDML